MKIKKLLLVLLAVLLVFSLFGCGKKEPVEDVEPQDTTEQLDENISDNITGKPSDNGHYSLTNEEISKEYEYGYMMASAMAQNSVSSLKSKAKANADKFGITYSDAQAFDLFAYGEAVSSAEIACSHYVVSFTYPSDGFQQFIDWRKRYESDHGLSNSGLVTSDTTQPSETPSAGKNNTSPNQGQQKPSGNTSNSNGSSNNNSGTSGSSGGAWYPSDYEDVPTDVTLPGSGMSDEKDFSGLNYGFKQ
jgi:predicted small lipoprotein YifL